MNRYYIVSLKHTSKGDTALTLWRGDFAGYTWNKSNAGIYTEADKTKVMGDDSVFVLKETADNYFLDAVDFGDQFTALPNDVTVRTVLGLNEKLMKPKRFASCRMKFIRLHQK